MYYKCKKRQVSKTCRFPISLTRMSYELDAKIIHRIIISKYFANYFYQGIKLH